MVTFIVEKWPSIVNINIHDANISVVYLASIESSIGNYNYFIENL